ncbi:SDR family oxidoreductase, partial [Bacillus spizizenii]|nr:SDR family oxidoreductase [Bacillus spizizenii]
MKLNLQGKTVLVTGSTSGIGKAIASSLAEEGAAVIINGRREEKVNQTIDELKTQHSEAVLYPAAYDLGTEEGCNDLFQAYPEVDILVNNLGIFEPAEYFDIPDDEWFRFFEVNIMSGVRLTRKYLHNMIEKKEGRVI